MATPCLSHLSFQLDRIGQVHALATYRSHYMTERAYGNYLGLGRLLGHISTQAGLQPGTLTVVAGYAQIEPGTITLIRPLLSEAVPLFPLPKLNS
jgi:thymidylate synthase